MTFIHFLLIAEEATAPRDDNHNVPKTFGATDFTKGKAI